MKRYKTSSGFQGILFLLFGALILNGYPVSASAADSVYFKPSGSQVIERGKDVEFSYTLTVDNAAVDPSEIGESPLLYTHGANELIPGLEKGLQGMKVGERKRIVVGPEEGFGVFDPGLIVEVPLRELPKDIIPEIGISVDMEEPNGDRVPATVREVKEKTVVLDQNHPYAGKTLAFDVTVTSIKQGDVNRTYHIPGIYSSLDYINESGDLVGMEVLIFPGGPGRDHSALVQIAEGEAPYAALVPVKVHGSRIRFTMPKNGPVGPEHYAGTIKDDALVIEYIKGGEEILKRGKSYWE
ncbi:MAG: peptidylprolyl isomerase [Candidatus Omnitrophica bacterium]|nr:peptidylprolyl isomerase [Candidatus Omnitrophota bacterium]